MFVFKKRRHFKIAKNCITLHGHPRIKGKEGRKERRLIMEWKAKERREGKKKRANERTALSG